MWRVTALTVRKSGLSIEAFRTQLLESVAPAITKAAHEDPSLRRFIVTLPPANLDPEVAKVFVVRFDGLLEFWFDSSQDAVAVMNAISRDARVLERAAETFDGAGGVAWLAEVFPKKPETGRTQIKFLAGGDVAEGWTVADAQKYWSEVHPVIAQTAPKVWGPLTRYVQFHGRPITGLDIGQWLAVARFVPMCADMGFNQPREFLANYTNDQYLSIVRPDEEKFSRPGEMLAFVGEERAFIGA
jgi:hypothetical protein